MHCRGSQRMEFDRCRHFDISLDAFRRYTIRDQTYFRRSRHAVAANCADGVSSALAHDSTSDEVCDIFSKPSASSLHHIRHIHGRTIVRPSRRQQTISGACT